MMPAAGSVPVASVVAGGLSTMDMVATMLLLVSVRVVLPTEPATALPPSHTQTPPPPPKAVPPSARSPMLVKVALIGVGLVAVLQIPPATSRSRPSACTTSVSDTVVVNGVFSVTEVEVLEFPPEANTS